MRRAESYKCGRCGRVFLAFEASINEVAYCHPFDLPLNERSCYMEQSYEMAFPRA